MNIGSTLKNSFKDPKIKNALMSAVGTAVGQIGGGAIGGGLQSGVGDTFSKLGGIASSIPGPIGMIGGAALGVLGGVTNRLFGSKLNQENISSVNSTIDQLNSFQSDANNYDDLANTWSSTALGSSFDNSYIGKNGVFNHSASKLANQLRDKIDYANSFVQNSLTNNANNISNNTMNMLDANYSAYGGLLNQFSSGGGIHINPANRGKFNATKERTGKTTEELTHSKNPLTRKRAIFAQNAAKWHHAYGGSINQFGEGGLTVDDINNSIPANVVKVLDPTGITSYYDVYQAGKKMYSNPSWSNFGSLALETLGAVPLVGKVGKVIKATNQLHRALRLAKKTSHASRELIRYYAPNVITTSANIAGAVINRNAAADDRRINRRAFGGDLNSSDFTNGVTFINEGGTHEENPYGGIMIGTDKQGIPNMVEEGEAIFNDYVFSNRIKVPKAIRKKFKLGGTNKTTFADAAKSVSKESEERPNDPISKAGLEDGMMKLMLAQEITKQKNEMRNRQQQNTFATGGGLGIYPDIRSGLYQNEPFINTSESALTPFSSNLNKPANPLDFRNNYNEPLFGFNKTSTLESKPLPLTSAPRKLNPVFNANVSAKPSTLKGSTGNNGLEPTWMRYAPVFATGAFSLTDALGLTNKPDYSDANAVLNAARNAGTYKPVSYNPIGNYLTYTPFDRDYYQNKANALTGATRRNLMNTAGNSRALAASLLAADYNSVDKLGELAKTAEEYNLKQRQTVEDFNRATNQTNSQGMLQADMANQTALANARNSYLSGMYNYASLREKERQAATAARSANLTNFINSLGAIGKENYSRNMIVSDPSKYYSIDNRGNVTYKNNYYNLPLAQQQYIDNIIKASNGK